MVAVGRIFLTGLALVGIAAADSAESPCVNYDNPKYPYNVTTKAACRSACEKVEGFCCPDFKENSGKFQCQCANNENLSGSHRDLCEDPGFKNHASSVVRPLMLIAAGILAMRVN
mmetsp:Transcript_19912/g.32768  ORF Transcript_19912/g.32768 Transcript_19912/m.32768 type:complete len:115 (+) Transcript_19912:60-404(+)